MKRHRADLASLIFGLVFLMIAAWWGLARRLHVDLPAVGWLAAVALIIVGAVGLVGAVRGPRDDAGGPVEDAVGPVSGAGRDDAGSEPERGAGR